MHSTQEAFSHSTSCITHEVLTESCTHSPFPLAVSSWHPAQGKMNKLFRPFSASFSLFPSVCLSRLWLCSHGLEVTGMEMGCWRESRQPPLQPQPALEPSRATLLVAPVKLDVCSVPTAPQRRITAGPVFRQSDRSQPEHPKNPGNQRSTHTSANIYILSLLVCFAKLSWFVSLHPFQLGIFFLTFPSVSLASLFLPQSPFNSALSHSLMFLSLSLPPSPFEIQ